MTFRQFFQRLQWMLWTTAAVLLVALALVVSLGRHYLQNIGQHQAAVLAGLQRHTGLTVTAAELSGSWRRLIPELQVVDVALMHPDTGEPVLQAGAATLRVDLLRSVLHLAPSIRQFTARGVEIELEEVSLGRWRLSGFQGTDGGDGDAILELILGVAQARFEQVELQLQFLTGYQTSIHADHLELSRSGGLRRLHGKLHLSDAEPPLDLLVESRGDPREPEAFRAHGHVRLLSMDLTPILPLLEPLGVILQEARVDGELWLEWRGTRQFGAQGYLSMPLLDLAGLSGHGLEPLTDITLQVSLQAEQNDWQLWLPTLQARWAGERIELDQLWLQGNDKGDVQLGLAQLELAPLSAALAGSGLLQERHREILEALAPRGVATRLRGRWPVDDQPLLRAEVKDFGLDPWHGAPGVEGAAGYVELGPTAGLVQLASTNVQLEFPPVYDHPLILDEVRAAVGWRWVDERVQVLSGPISGRTDMGLVRGRLHLNLPAAPGAEQPPEMTLVLGLTESHSRYHEVLVPTMLDTGLRQWLAEAIGPAEVPRGGLIYRGSLRAEDEAARTVQLWLEVRNGTLDYYPPWPALRAVDARVLLDDGNTDVVAYRAHTLAHTQVEQARFTFDMESRRLSGQAHIRSADADVLQAVTATPLRQWVGDSMDQWQWTGQVQARLDLDLPLGGGNGESDMPWVRVLAELDSGRLELGNLDLSLHDIEGTVRYRSTAALPPAGSIAGGSRLPRQETAGLSADALRGKLFGQPLQARVGQQGDRVRIMLETPSLAIADLHRWLALPVPLDTFAHGSTPVTMQVELGRGAAQLEARSDLRGVDIALPAPWGKSAERATPLQLSMPLPDGRLQLSLGESLQLAWDVADGGGALALGNVALPQLEPGRLRVAGVLGMPDLTEWRRTWAAWTAHQGDPTKRVSGSGLALELTELYLTGLSIPGQAFSNIRATGRHSGRDFRLQLQADQFSGELVVPAPSGTPLALWLGRLDLHSSTTWNAGAITELEPGGWPALEFAVGALYLDGELLGGLRFDLTPMEEGLRLDGLGGSLRGVSITGQPDQRGASLTWRRDPTEHSEFRGRLLSGDLARVLTRFGYEPALTNERARMDVQMSWPGGLKIPGLAELSGSASLNIERGRFVNVSDSTSGALKAVGIFNLANLTRRLRLDFSDIVSSGVSFTDLEGDLQLQQGVVSTLEPLRVRSSVSRFQANGLVDFTTDQVDMELIATLPIASNLPWVAALAGGLPAAAGVFIVGKLLEEQMDRYSSVVYRISGDWRDPRLEFMRMFDDSEPQPR